MTPEERLEQLRRCLETLQANEREIQALKELTLAQIQLFRKKHGI